MIEMQTHENRDFATLSWIEAKGLAFLGFLSGAMATSIVGAYVKTFHFMDTGKFNSPVPHFLIVLFVVVPLNLFMATIFAFLVPKRSLPVTRRRSFVAAQVGGVFAFRKLLLDWLRH